MDRAGARPEEFVESLAKGLAILECFDATHSEMTLSEIARRVGLSPAAARRSLLTLAALGYVGQRERRYHLRPKVMTLGFTFYAASRIDEVMQPHLRAIVDRFGDAASVGVLDGADVIYLASASVQRARRATAAIGARYPAHATSIGRVLLASLPMGALDAFFRRWRPVSLTPATLTEEPAVRAELGVVGRQGYATTVDQLDYGITALAVPVRNAGNEIVAALNTSGYTGLTSPEALVAERLVELRAAAQRISADFARFPVLNSALGL